MYALYRSDYILGQMEKLSDDVESMPPLVRQAFLEADAEFNGGDNKVFTYFAKTWENTSDEFVVNLYDELGRAVIAYQVIKDGEEKLKLSLEKYENSLAKDQEFC